MAACISLALQPSSHKPSRNSHHSRLTPERGATCQKKIPQRHCKTGNISTLRRTPAPQKATHTLTFPALRGLEHHTRTSQVSAAREPPRHTGRAGALQGALLLRVPDQRVEVRIGLTSGPTQIGIERLGAELRH